MITDADGSHFDARTQFRGFFAVTWNDVANGPQRGLRVRGGGVLRLIGQANKFVATYSYIT